MMSRRRMLGAVAGGLASQAIAPAILRGRYQVFAGSQERYSGRTLDLVGRSLVIDMLAPLNLRKIMAPYAMGYARATGRQVTMAELLGPDADYAAPDVMNPALLRDLRASGMTVVHHSVGTGASHAELFEYFNNLNGMIANNSDHLMRVDSVDDLERIKRDGRVGVILGTQNSDHFRFMQPDDVRLFHRAGQRVSQLTYNARNLIGTGATDRSDGGLSDWGVQVVAAMNEVGMAVDVSHCGDQTSIDAAELSTKPILITHSNSRVVVGGHPRTKPDSVIKAVCSRGGVMGMSFMSIFVRDRDPVTVEHVIDHYDYVAKLVGVEHLGIGSDSDVYGYDQLPSLAREYLHTVGAGKYRWRETLDIPGLNHPKRTFDLVEGLLRRGYSEAQVEGILGRNFARVLSEIWS